MSSIGEDHEIILNASLSNSPESADTITDSSRLFLEQINAFVPMNSNAVKNGIEDIAARLKQNGNSSSIPTSSKSNGASSSTASASVQPTDPTTISNHTPSMQLSCVECGVSKTNSEDMEIHIKTEHLNWLPFQCPMCLTERASDSQMREHLHSSHQKNMNKFIYVDNVTAKRKLQVLMDKAFSLNVTKRVNANTTVPTTSTSPYSPTNNYRNFNSTPSSGRNTSTSNGSSVNSAAVSAQAAASAIVNHHKEKEKQQAQATADLLKLLDFSAINGEAAVEQKASTSIKPNTARKRPYVPTSATESITTMELGPSNADQFLATLNSLGHAQTPENEENDQLSASFSLDDLNIDHNSTLASLFGGGAKKIKYETGTPTESVEDGLEGLNGINSVLDNYAALFGTPDRTVDVETKKTSSVSKKRVLGECSKCQKPVTAGARQMHMFFHLAKDESIFRFRCKHDGCAVEHYRKDQMENHQSKAHGRIDPDMMEDRSLELFQKCQELNHELFVAHRHGHRSSPHQWSGGSADIAGYQNAQKSKLPGTPTLSGTSSGSTNGFGPLKLVPDEDHPLQCRLCGKTMQNRIRGFHILWHMAKDKGINRYTCKYCDFGHDRSQSVQVHGKKEHGTDDCVEDRIGEYQDDVKEMSESCFGISSLFAQESKRKNKFPAAAPRENKDVALIVAEQLLVLDEEASNDSTVKEETPEVKMEMVKEEVEEDEDEEPEAGQEDDEEDDDVDEDGSTAPVTSSKKKKWRSRFNIRTKKSKKQKEDAVVARNVSILIGGAQFYKKKVNEFCYCEKCGKQTNSRLPEHAYTHMNGTELYGCSACPFGNQCKETVMKHMREQHPACGERCVDNRLSHIKDIKNMLRECFPAFFIDHPLPTRTDIEKLVILANGGDIKVGGVEEYLRDECDEVTSEAPEDEEEDVDDVKMDEEDEEVSE